MVSNSKGWHNESLRHSEAKRFGKASVGKVSAPKNVKSISKKSKPNVVSISNKNISVKDAVKYHRQEAVKSLKENDVQGYNYHSTQVANLNYKLELTKLRAK